MTATPGQTSAELARRLADRGDAGKRAWWERYLKGEAVFHGVPIATVRDVVWPWYDHQPAEVADWNTCDWLCVRVLGPLIERHGEVAARTIAGWRDAAGLWRRRAAVVAFVDLVGRDEEPFPGCRQLVLDTCASKPTRSAWRRPAWAGCYASCPPPPQSRWPSSSTAMATRCPRRRGAAHRLVTVAGGVSRCTAVTTCAVATVRPRGSEPDRCRRAGLAGEPCRACRR